MIAIESSEQKLKEWLLEEPPSRYLDSFKWAMTTSVHTRYADWNPSSRLGLYTLVCIRSDRSADYMRENNIVEKTISEDYMTSIRTLRRMSTWVKKKESLTITFISLDKVLGFYGMEPVLPRLRKKVLALDVEGEKKMREKTGLKYHCIYSFKNRKTNESADRGLSLPVGLTLCEYFNISVFKKNMSAEEAINKVMDC